MLHLLKPFILRLLGALALFLEFTKRVSLLTGNIWTVVATLGVALGSGWLVFLRWGDSGVTAYLGVIFVATLVMTAINYVSSAGISRIEKMRVKISRS